MRLAVVGAGFAGSVLARELALRGQHDVTVFDERPHVAGNCHTSRDPATGIMLHHYGPHIFHTSRSDVWAYVNRFATFRPFVNRVKAVTARGVFTLPVNLLTINQIFGKAMGPAAARAFLETVGEPIAAPRNFEEQALAMLGRDLYDTFFHGYTKKQWGLSPKVLPASILKRLPVRFSYDDNYYDSRYQGIPEEGYTALVERLLDHACIRVELGRRVGRDDLGDFDHVFWSGPLDAYFGFDLGRLQYRTLRFERFDSVGDYQGTAVVNYCDETVPWTRIAEHKHFAPWERHEQTVCFAEYSSWAEPGDTPYYPLRLADDKTLLADYVARAREAERVTFLGRLGTYRYLDMHAVIGESLDLAAACLTETDPADWPRWSAEPLGPPG